jgi:hypothetical protein
MPTRKAINKIQLSALLLLLGSLWLYSGCADADDLLPGMRVHIEITPGQIATLKSGESAIITARLLDEKNASVSGDWSVSGYPAGFFDVTIGSPSNASSTSITIRMRDKITPPENQLSPYRSGNMDLGIFVGATISASWDKSRFFTTETMARFDFTGLVANKLEMAGIPSVSVIPRIPAADGFTLRAFVTVNLSGSTGFNIREEPPRFHVMASGSSPRNPWFLNYCEEGTIVSRTQNGNSVRYELAYQGATYLREVTNITISFHVQADNSKTGESLYEMFWIPLNNPSGVVASQ